MSTAETRETILVAAWRLMKTDASNVTMASIARAAEVSRQAVYLHFESRAGLLLALVRWRDEASNFFSRIDRASNNLEPLSALEGCLRTWLNYLPELDPVPLYLARARDDPPAYAAWSDRMRALEALYREPIVRLDAEGSLLLSPDRAVAAVRAVAGLSAWQHLVKDCGWGQRAAVDTIWRATCGAILHPDACRGTER
ncbi:MAG: TetR/AcrR family transcriptional regulator [Nannocystales bacterium]